MARLSWALKLFFRGYSWRSAWMIACAIRKFRMDAPLGRHCGKPDVAHDVLYHAVK